MTTKTTKARNSAICSSKEALTSARPILTCDGSLAELAALAAPFPARISTMASSPMKVVQTRPGCRGDRYGR